ncbi:MAG: ABC transporter permease [Syntrophomonadaceae bacterium]|nr:ABC transporter permease [Syntrophomonadaceae bacterium]MDD4549019.1 ABC transporter permease [Syntrophomonadaceae bacterium]
MNSIDLIRMSVGNLFRRKTRTFLTILGVVIGTSSIIIMLSLGVAMDKSFKEDLSRMGSLNIIEVNNYGRYSEPGMDQQNTQTVKLDDDAVSSFEKIPGVEAVMPIKSSYMKIGTGKMVGNVDVIGIKPEIMKSFDFSIEEGRLLSDTDKNAIVFGKQVAFNFYNPRLRNRYDGQNSEQPPVDLISNKLILTSDMEYGERKRNRSDQDSDYKPPKPHEVKGIGILAESNSEKDYQAYMNVIALEKILEEDRKVIREDRSRRRSDEEDKYHNVKVKVADIEQVESVQEAIKALGFQTYSLTDMRDSMKKTSRTIQAILGGIGAVSLLVAAIGITNTMIMSIYERTKEIGIIKVLGANIADIKKLFLLEAALIGFGGGVIGLILSYTVSFALNKIAAGFMGEMGTSTQISVISIGLALSAVAFATIVGIISGYSPARRAMKLSALEAIRNE